MMIVLFSIKLGWLPTSGMVTIGAGYTGLAHWVDVARHMILPVVTLSLFHTAFYARLMRASMLEVFKLDFVTTARAKGLSENRIVYRHVLRPKGATFEAGQEVLVKVPRATSCPVRRTGTPSVMAITVLMPNCRAQ